MHSTNCFLILPPPHVKAIGLWLLIHLKYHLYHFPVVPTNREASQVLAWELTVLMWSKSENTAGLCGPLRQGRQLEEKSRVKRVTGSPHAHWECGSHINLRHDSCWLLTYIWKDQKSCVPSCSLPCTLTCSPSWRWMDWQVACKERVVLSPCSPSSSSPWTSDLTASCRGWKRGFTWLLISLTIVRRSILFCPGEL